MVIVLTKLVSRWYPTPPSELVKTSGTSIEVSTSMLALPVSKLTRESLILYASVQKELYAFVNGLIAYDY